MDTTLIVIIVLAIAALVALGIFLNERRKKRNKAKHLATKKAHPASIIPANTIQTKRFSSESTEPALAKIKTELNDKGHHVVQQSYTAPTFRKETSRLQPSTGSTPKTDSYKARYDDNYYPSNTVTDAALLAAIISSQSVTETENILRDHVGLEPVTPSYEAPATSSSDSGSNGSYSNSYDSNGSSGGYSSYESNGSSPSWSSSSDLSSSSSSSYESSSDSSSSYSSDSGSPSFSFD